jgi:hypothetical protein
MQESGSLDKKREEEGTCNSALAVRLLVLENAAELKRLARAGWITPLAPDRWRIADIVQGRIKQLIAQATTYNAVQMAGALALTDPRVRQLTAEGRIKTISKGKYDRDATTRDYVIWLRDQNKLANTSTSESRVREARASEIEIRTAARTRRLVTLDEALESNALVCGLVRTEFGGLAAQLTRDLGLRRDIEKAVNGCLARIAARLIEEAAALRAGRAAVDAVADDDAGSVGGQQPQLSAVVADSGTA